MKIQNYKLHFNEEFLKSPYISRCTLELKHVGLLTPLIQEKWQQKCFLHEKWELMLAHEWLNLTTIRHSPSFPPFYSSHVKDISSPNGECCKSTLTRIVKRQISILNFTERRMIKTCGEATSKDHILFVEVSNHGVCLVSICLQTSVPIYSSSNH